MNKREFIREFTASSIKLFDQDENLIYKGKVNDISAGGILVVTCGLEDLEDFYPGEGIKFTLQIPTGEVSGVAEIACRGVVEDAFCDLKSRTGFGEGGFCVNKFFCADFVFGLFEFFERIL